jgi:hypothetical protein
MGEFGITTARKELGFTPSTGVRGNVNVRGIRGEGAAIGQALIAGFKIWKARQEMQDGNSSVEAAQLRKVADAEFETFKLKNPQDTWVTERKRLDERTAGEIGSLQFSSRAREVELSKQSLYSQEREQLALASATRQLQKETLIIQTKGLEEAFAQGDPQKKIDQVKTFMTSMAAMGMKKDIVELRIADAKKKGMTEAITNLYRTGNHNEARKMLEASDLGAREKEQLDDEIDVDERVQNNAIDNAKRELVNRTTSTTIREYFSKDLTIDTLNERHAAGLIKDTDYKFMIKGLQQPVSAITDPFAAGKIRRAYVDFEMGAINRGDADTIVLENYARLSNSDRANVISDLEDVSAKIIGTAKSNAYDEGTGLMSVQFVGIRSQDDFERLFISVPGLSEEEKIRVNRRWNAELSNRDLYERAVDERFREMRKEGVSSGDKFKAESLDILLQYQRRKQLGLEQLEAEVSKEQQKIIVRKGEPIVTVKDINEMTTEEKQKELERIRAMRRLIR